MLLKYTTLGIWKFRNRTVAQDYLNFQRTNGNSMKGARIRMRKHSEHEWANRVGNVAVIKVGRDPGGDLYLFSDGISRNEYFDKMRLINS